MSTKDFKLGFCFIMGFLRGDFFPPTPMQWKVTFCAQGDHILGPISSVSHTKNVVLTYIFCPFVSYFKESLHRCKLS